MPVDARLVTDDSPRTGDKATAARSFTGSGNAIAPGPANSPLGSAGFSRNETVDIFTSTAAGTFTITAEAVTTGAISNDATAAQVLAALVAAGGSMTAATVSVQERAVANNSGFRRCFRLTFIGAFGNSNRTDVTASGATVVKVQDGAAAPAAGDTTYLGQTSGITAPPGTVTYSVQAANVIRAVAGGGLPTGANKLELLVVQTPTQDVAAGTDAALQESPFTSYAKELGGGVALVGYKVVGRATAAAATVNATIATGTKVIAVVRGINDVAGSEAVGPWAAQSGELTVAP